MHLITEYFSSLLSFFSLPSPALTFSLFYGHQESCSSSQSRTVIPSLSEVLMMTPLLLLLLPLASVLGEHHHAGRGRAADPIDGEDEDFWTKKGEEELAAALALTPNTGVAKNIILFIGDGMSLPTVAAARVFKGQKTGDDGAGSELFWESFPHMGHSKTYCANYMVPDSAATASAMYTGQKTTFFTMGYNSSAKLLEPNSVTKEAEQETILDWAQAAGKKTGFVTTTRMSHATPAALYAKTVQRFWEGDQDITKSINEGEVNATEVKDVKDISLQLVESEAGRKMDIMLGGGRASFLPESEKPQELLNKTEPRFDYDDERDIWDNYRLDGRNLIDEWKNISAKRRYVANRTELLSLDASQTDHVMGIFTNSYVTWDDMVADAKDKPTLSDMATASVKFLKAKAGAEGFFIMIEGGRIDAAHHNGHAVRALSETLAFEKAIQEVVSLVDLEETLVLVTADHAHTMSIGGYTNRTLDITGSVEVDGRDISVLSYGNGPGFQNLVTTGKGNYTFIDSSNVTLDVDASAELHFRQPSASPLKSETHGGDDVGIWASGPWAHLVHGTHQQSYIATVMSYSACLGKYKDREGCITTTSASNRASHTSNYMWLLVLAISSLLY